MEDNDYKARQEMLRELNQMLDAEMAKPIQERNYDRIEELLHSYADVIGIAYEKYKKLFFYYNRAEENGLKNA